MRNVYIGTSGWSYKGWLGTSYPHKLPAARHFEHYATHFPTVEINLTFYRLPAPELVQGWRRKAPRGFVYALKGSRFITHMKKLVGVEAALETYFRRIEPLRARLGPILWQLPPQLSIDEKRLERFLSCLPGNHRYAIEFRHPSWLHTRVFEILRSREVAFVSVSSLRMPMTLVPTADFVYIRFHGLEHGAAHDYTNEELQPWANYILQQASLGRTVYAYFNNDWNTRAPANARTLMTMTGAAAVPALAA